MDHAWVRWRVVEPASACEGRPASKADIWCQAKEQHALCPWQSARRGYLSLGIHCHGRMNPGKLRFLFTAGDYEATVRFYRDGLGLPIEGGWDRGPGDRGTLFSASSGTIEVMEPNPGREFTPPRGISPVLEVDDVDQSYERIRRNGLPIVQKIADQPWGHRNFIVKDPDGIEVHFFSVIR